MGTNWRSLCGIFILVPLLLDLHVRHIAGWPVCGHLMFTKVEIKYLECWFFLWILNSTKWSAVARSCPSLCDPMDCSLAGSSVHGIFQAIVLEWIVISFSRGSSWPRGRTHVTCIGRQILYHWASREALILQILLCILDIQFRLFLLLTLLLNSIPSAHPDHFSRNPTYAYQSFIGSRRKREPISLSPTHDLFWE